MSAFYKTGLHVGECTGQFMGQSDNENKTPYFALKFRIVARVENEQEHQVESSERTVYLYLSEKALPMATEVLDFLGYDKDSLKFLNPDQQGFFNFAGKRCDLWCKIEEYQGDSKEKWSISTPRKPVTPIDDKELRRLDSLFGKAIRAQRGPGLPAAMPAQPASTLKRTERGEIVGVDESQRGAAGVGRPEATLPPTVDEIPFSLLIGFATLFVASGMIA